MSRSQSASDSAIGRAGALGDAEGAGDARRDEHRVADRLERHEEDAVGEVVGRPAPRAGATAGSCRSRPARSASAAGSLASSRPAASSSASRPTNVVSWVGRLFGRASSDRSGGKSAGRPSATTWTMRTGALRSLSRCSPRSRSVTPSTGWSTSWSRIRPDARIWPPWATAAIRAARLMPRPTRLSPDCSAPPVWRPIRTRIGASSGHGSAASARCAATAAATAAGASWKATKNESPSVPCSTPPCAAGRRAEDRAMTLAELGVAIAADRPARAASSPRCR